MNSVALRWLLLGVLIGHLGTRWSRTHDFHALERKLMHVSLHGSSSSSSVDSSQQGGQAALAAAAAAASTAAAVSSLTGGQQAGTGCQQQGMGMTIAGSEAPAVQLDEEGKRIVAALQQCCPDKEVIVAVANKGANWDGMMGFWAENLREVGAAHKVLIMALDQETVDLARAYGMSAVLVQRKVAEGYDNHGISAHKFGLLLPVVAAGWSPLLMDIDITVLKNPFSVLHRDHDLEGMSDGFDDATAYGVPEGFDDPSMGWSRYAETFRHFALNSGLFYLRAGPKTVALLQRLAYKVTHEETWDQSAYNQVVFTLSHGAYKSPQLSVRVMEVDVAMNSKRLFKDVRHRPPEQQPPMPAMVHVNYHPDKIERMRAVKAYYKGGDKHALDSFPDKG